MSPVDTKISELLLKTNDTNAVTLTWIKAHCGITGNEIVDGAAKDVHKNAFSSKCTPSEYDLLRELRGKIHRQWELHWECRSARTGTGLFLRSICDKLEQREWSFGRHEDAVLTRLRTGHAAVEQYCYRFNLKDSLLCNFCKVPDTIQHYLLECHRFGASRAVLISELKKLQLMDPSLVELLGGRRAHPIINKVLNLLVQFLRATKIKQL
jgi:hypothetical protein